MVPSKEFRVNHRLFWPHTLPNHVNLRNCITTPRPIIPIILQINYEFEYASLNARNAFDI